MKRQQPIVQMPANDITLKEIKDAHHKLAQLVMIDRAYLPIFERLENEIAEREAADALFERARAVANG